MTTTVNSVFAVNKQVAEYTCYDTAQNFYLVFPAQLKRGDVIDVFDLAPFQAVAHIGAVYESTSDHVLIVGEKPSSDHFILTLFLNQSVPLADSFNSKAGIKAIYQDDDFPKLDMSCYIK
jgi:hypothetical protein